MGTSEGWCFERMQEWLAGPDAIDKGLDAVDEGHDTVVEGRDSVENCNAICEGDVPVGVRAINVDRETVDGGVVSPGVHVSVTDVGCEGVDGGDVSVNPAPPTTASLSPVPCLSVPPTFASSSKFRGSLV